MSNNRCVDCDKRKAAHFVGLDEREVCNPCFKRAFLTVDEAHDVALTHNWLFHSRPVGHGLAWCPECRVWVKVAA